MRIEVKVKQSDSKYQAVVIDGSITIVNEHGDKAELHYDRDGFWYAKDGAPSLEIRTLD